MADRLTVDLEGLSEFSARLRRIQERLAEAKRDLTGDGQSLGDERVVAALADFEEHWRDGRKKVADNADALATMAGEAVKTFRAVDERLRQETSEAGRQLAAAARTVRQAVT